jgi:hypothetical protein
VDVSICLFAFVVFTVWAVSAVVQSMRRSMNSDQQIRQEHRVYRQVADRGHFVRSRGRGGLQAVRAAFRALAVMRGGEFHDYGFMGMPKVTFVHKAGRALLTVYESGQQPPEFFLQLTILVPAGWEHRLEVYRQLFSDEEIALKGIEDLKIGDDEFDPKYIIKSDSLDVAKDFFTAPVKQAVNEIRYMGDRDYVLVSINRERIMVRKAPLLESVDHLRPFVDAVCSMYDRLDDMSTKEMGVELQESESEEPPTCQVCGAQVTDPANKVYCRRCHTPHHEDCWEFNKKCSTYACGETFSVRKT